MQYIRFNYNNYPVSNEVYQLVSEVKRKYCYIERWVIEGYVIKILESENYLTGKIPYQTLLVAIEQIYYREEWLNLFTSKIYSTGSISHDVAVDLIRMIDRNKWKNIDEKYNCGIIKEDHIRMIIEIVKNEFLYLSTKKDIINIIYRILTSDNYANGMISDEIIKLILPTEIYFKQSDDNIKENTDDMKEKPQLEYCIIINIIYQIITTKLISQDEKEGYILAIINLKNKKELIKLYDLYSKEKKVQDISNFAENFVLITLPTLQLDFKGSYTKKLTPQHENN